MTTIPKQLGKYELQEQPGRGGMAEVWKAFDPQLKRYVAIKILHADLRTDPDFMSRFEREAQVIAALHHPNIVQIHDFQVSTAQSGVSTPYMVMDYIEGGTLADYIRAMGHAGILPSPETVLHLFAAIGTAVDYAHQQGVVHRDIKSSNILLDKRNILHDAIGEPILTDFGLVKILGTAAATVTGTSMGTPAYVSPEQARGYHGNERSDIYSLGVVLYELCTGVTPFRGDSPYAVMVQHIQAQPAPPSSLNPQLPPALDVVILRCLAKDPANRFPKASSIAAAIAEAYGLPIPHEVSQPAYPIEETERPTVYNPPPSSAPRKQVTPRPLSEDDEHAPTVPLDDNQTKQEPSVTPVQPNAAPSPQTPAVVRTLPRRAGQQLTRRPRVRTMAIITLLLLLLASTATALVRLHTGGSANAESTNIVGSATFASSGQLNDQGIPSNNDIVYVRLQHLADPASGKNYYVWLRGNQIESDAVLLGALKVNQGAAALTYQDQQHRDLLAMNSNLLITEESTRATPIAPSPDKTTWRFQGALPQQRSQKDGLSYLDHVRHLLSSEPELNKLGLHGGVDLWFLTSMEQMQKQSIEVRDHVTLSNVRQQLTNILYLLDGVCAQQELQHVPAGAPSTLNDTGIQFDSRLPLLDCAQLPPEPPGHLTHIALHLNGLIEAPGASQAQIKLASRLTNSLGQLRAKLEQVRQDTIQLANMPDDQLTQAHALRAELALQASSALSGSIDPTTQNVELSARQLCESAELLATVDVQRIA